MAVDSSVVVRCGTPGNRRLGGCRRATGHDEPCSYTRSRSRLTLGLGNGRMGSGHRRRHGADAAACPSDCPGWAHISDSTHSRQPFSRSSIWVARRQASMASAMGGTNGEPGRVLPFFPAFLAGMNLVVLADDAFTFLLTWEFMSLTSWALVMAHHRQRDNARAGYIYLLMASLGTLSLLLWFWPPGRPRRRLRVRCDSQCPSFAEHCHGRPRADLARRRLEGGASAAARLVATGPSGGAQPRVRSDERRNDQGRGVRIRADRVRPDGTDGLVVGCRGTPLRRRQRRSGGAPRADGTRSQAPARLSHGGEHRDHLHRTGSRAGLSCQRHGGRRRAGDDRGAVSRIQSLGLQEPPLLRRRRGPQRNRSARHGATGRTHPRHAGHRLRLPHRFGCHFRTASLQWFRFRVADVPGDSR